MAEKRKIGAFGVGPVGLGCMSISHGYGSRPSEADGERVVAHALDIGYDFFDTAAVYGAGHNEQLVGRAIGHRRDEYVLASKCGFALPGDESRRVDGRPETLKAVLDGSLQRLGVDHIDLYYLHRCDPTVPIEDSVGTLAEGVKAGKIGAIGLSEVSAELLRRAHAVHPIAALQTEYSLWTRNPEIALLDTCRELGTTFVAFSPVGRGFLADAVQDPAQLEPGDMRIAMPRFIDPCFSENMRLLDRFRDIAREESCTTAQLALAWLHTKHPDLVSIPGTTSITHAEDNFAAGGMTLSSDVMERLESLINERTVSGSRYPPFLQATVTTEEFA